MALPMSNTPIYTLRVPSTKQEYKFKPFLVKQEKALLIAFQSEDEKVMVNTLKEVIKDCVMGMDISTLSLFDIEYIFCQIRSKAVGETVELIGRCDSEECLKKEESKKVIVVNIADVEVFTPEGHEKKISLFEDVGVVMKYPSLDLLLSLKDMQARVIKGKEKESATNNYFDIVAQSIEYIYDGQQIFYTKEQTKEEVLTFVENLTSEQFKKLINFFNTMPKLTKDIKWNCSVCSKEQFRKIEGLANFFS